MPPIRKLLSAGLFKSGFEVIEAADGGTGLDQFALHKPDVILLDVCMPGMDGFAVCAKLRSLPGGKMVPIIVTSQ